MAYNSKRFLDAFSAIEKRLQLNTKSERAARFSELIDRGSKIDAAVRSMYVDLQEFSDLRNAIVHERTDGRVIAEPNEWAVKKIEKMVELITRPPMLRDFMTRNVKVLQADRPIAEAVKFLYKENYSQAPVLRGGRYLELLTANTITRWLGANVADEIFSLLETSISDVLKYTEDPEHVVFLRPETPVFEALELIQRQEAKGKRVEAILVTNSGKPGESLLGMLTIWDLPKLYKAIDVGSR